MSRITSIVMASAAVLAGGCTSTPESVPAESATAHFTDIGAEAGLGSFVHRNAAGGNYWFPETMGAGAAFADIDGDGLLDIVLVGGGDWEDANASPLQVYRNTGSGGFERLASAEPSGLSAYGFGIVGADFDNDGDTDLFYTALGTNALLRNDGGRLVDVSAQAGTIAPPAWSTAAAFFDADQDGWLDLYVARYVEWSPETDIYCSQNGEDKGYCTPELYPGVSGTLYRNRGDGTFEDATAAAGLADSHGKTLGALVLDFNRDGHPDLMLANDTEPDELFLNRGDGTFEEIGVVSGVAFDERGRARAGMGIESGVVDDTGEETVFVGNFSSEMIGVYRHMGNDVFLDRAAASRIGQPSLLTLSFGMTLVDVDQDGDLDLFVANGHVQPHIESVKENISFRQPPHLFLNQGDGTFTDAASQAGLTPQGGWLARAAAWGDFDQDGDPDLLVTENAGGAHLLRNDSNSAGFLALSLRGTTSNTMGIGSAVTVWTQGRRQDRFVRSGGSYLSQSQVNPLFGLGDAPRVDSVVVRWPSGLVSRVTDIRPGTRLQITEGE